MSEVRLLAATGAFVTLPSSLEFPVDVEGVELELSVS
jgi:hypothetical protein